MVSGKANDYCSTKAREQAVRMVRERPLPRNGRRLRRSRGHAHDAGDRAGLTTDERGGSARGSITCSAATRSA